MCVQKPNNIILKLCVFVMTVMFDSKLSIIYKIFIHRRSIWKTLESKVSFVLAKLIVYIDTNNNLDTLFSQNDENPEWLKSLWLALFKEERVDIRYL